MKINLLQDLDKKQVSVSFIIQISFFMMILNDIFFVQYSSDLRIFFLLGLWVLLLKIAHISYVATYKVALFLLVLLVGNFILSRDSISTDKTGLWVYLFLTLGIFQNILSYLRSNKLKQ